MYYTTNHDPEYYNAHCSMVNCASYAMNIKEWWDPEIEEDYGSIYEWVDAMEDCGYTLTEMQDIIAEEYIDAFLNDFPSVRALDKSTDIQPDEELIAFRICLDLDDDIDFDFHFRVFRDGKWSEKNGNGLVHDCSMAYWGKYNSKTFYFGHKVKI